MNISLKQLRVFVAITQEKTITAAAQQLYLSKAAVSMSLGELEKQVGHVLFDRVNNRLILNREGKRLLPLADEILHRANDIDELFQSDQPLHGELHIGASDTIGNQVAPFLLSGFRSLTNHNHQSLFISNTASICEKLADYELDIGLIEGKTQHPQLITQPWCLDEMCIIASPNHELAKKDNLGVRDLEYTQWLLRESGSGSREFFTQRIAPRLEYWQEAFQLNTTEAIINCTAANLGLACLSRRSAQYAIDDGRVVTLDLPIDFQRKFWILLHKEKYQSPLLKTFLEFCSRWQA
ncbi:LysR substrate-binding domain-containing protein [Vibrio nigripulchritudo]|uniref:LysR substrate-binding domain-containing protein n=1 Tax=Vibrio nigripulchritudo TaxID=28173 RepID=UPI0005F9B2C3|nr:LysR substrate-binding domain-containing protein [Vibrio nigripulchritudo]KJY80433.1 XRE family transcriptional regulator [Vibrio nigripulchritudo]